MYAGETGEIPTVIILIAMHSFICFALLFTSIFLEPKVTDENCTITKCGHGALDIQYPFLVRGQVLQHPHRPGFVLDCNNTTTTLHFPSYGDLVVKSIAYDIKKLDLIDPKSCVHEVFLNLNLSLSPFKYYYVVKEYSYLNCSVRLSPSFSEVPCLSDPAYHVYTVEPSLAVPNSCRVVKTIPIPFAFSDYLSDNSFGLGLTWGLDGNKDPQEKEGSNSLRTKTEQQTECFTMAHVKVVCIAIFIFMAAVALISINMHRRKKLQFQKGRQDQIEVEKLLGDYNAHQLERCQTRQQSLL